MDGSSYGRSIGNGIKLLLGIAALVGIIIGVVMFAAVRCT